MYWSWNAEIRDLSSTLSFKCYLQGFDRLAWQTEIDLSLSDRICSFQVSSDFLALKLPRQSVLWLKSVEGAGSSCKNMSRNRILVVKGDSHGFIFFSLCSAFLDLLLLSINDYLPLCSSLCRSNMYNRSETLQRLPNLASLDTGLQSSWRTWVSIEDSW